MEHACIYINKSGNFKFQRQSFSLHKGRPLVKPLVIVSMAGYFISLMGPYITKNNDATILNHVMKTNIEDICLGQRGRHFCHWQRIQGLSGFPWGDGNTSTDAILHDKGRETDANWKCKLQLTCNKDPVGCRIGQCSNLTLALFRKNSPIKSNTAYWWLCPHCVCHI